MKLLLEIPEDKAEFVKQVLENFSFIIEVKEVSPDESLNEDRKIKKEKSSSESPTEYLNRL